MNEHPTFPEYVPRPETEQLREAAETVHGDKQSRALLLYGLGGIGKTTLVRNLADAGQDDQRIRWLRPIDVDDPDYWLLSTLERKVAHQLDPENTYFGKYFDYLSHLESFSSQRIARETVVSHLGMIKSVFTDCYQDFIHGSGSTVVLFFDTVETVRGVFLVYTLTQWMKELPGTLFVLSGRPPTSDGVDPLAVELGEDPYRNMPVTTVTLQGFSQEVASDYLRRSAAGPALNEDEISKIALLTRGHPLWLAFAVSFMARKGIPEEVQENTLEYLREVIPYEQDMPPEGQQLNEAFRRRLVTPYREVDFWSEAVNRLAVVRQAVSKQVWERLMSDRDLPPDVGTIDEAWERLLETPWIRPRANGRLVTLHDAVAEELAQRIIPFHDRSQERRKGLWRRAAEIYREVNAEPEAELERSLSDLDRAYDRREARRTAWTVENRTPTPEETAEEEALIREVAVLEAKKRRIDQSRAVGFYYQFLSDFRLGCEQFLSLFDEGAAQGDVFLQDRLVLEMQRFLPTSMPLEALDDVIRAVIADFHRWLVGEGQDFYTRVGTSVASYLIDTQKSGQAMDLLEQLSTDDERQHFRISILKGNALMRVPQAMEEAESHFRAALEIAKAMTEDDGHRWIAKAYKEFGFFYRHRGWWSRADYAYRTARNALLLHDVTVSDEDRDEMASVQTNWAYVKGLLGEYLDGRNLVESAINVRKSLGQPQGEGFSWSVRGELFRFERHYFTAWQSYAEAQRIFERLRDWSWLGVVYQEQASCLFLASGDKVQLLPGSQDQEEEAQSLIIRALDICHDQNLRSYPSALNRAGRIFGAKDVDAGLEYLRRGIEQATRLSDGWFLLANLVEYVELCHREWEKNREPRYLQDIEAHQSDIEQAVGSYDFPDLEGRWRFIQGSLAIDRATRMNETAQFTVALEHFTKSFWLMSQGFVGSSGAYAIPDYFQRLKVIVKDLPDEVRAGWVAHFHQAWFSDDPGATLLLARLQELY
jgi:tetratricopeptide (TPR) repeat protein